WDELRTLINSGIVEVGTHTRTHPILSKLAPSQLRDEVLGSKQIVEARLGIRVRHFCYPNGLYSDFHAGTAETVREGGYESAVTAESGLNSNGTDLFTLLRLAVGPEQPYHYFQQAIT